MRLHIDKYRHIDINFNEMIDDSLRKLEKGNCPYRQFGPERSDYEIITVSYEFAGIVDG